MGNQHDSLKQRDPAAMAQMMFRKYHLNSYTNRERAAQYSIQVHYMIVKVQCASFHTVVHTSWSVNVITFCGMLFVSIVQMFYVCTV